MVGVSENYGYPQIIHFNRVFHYFYHPFWGTTTFGNTHLGGGNSNMFLFSPRKLGKMNPFWRIFFRMGWFNHQLVMVGEDRIEIHATLPTLWYWGLWWQCTLCWLTPLQFGSKTKVKRLKKNLWYWGSDQGRQGWCMLKILNEERFRTPESSKMTG